MCGYFKYLILAALCFACFKCEDQINRGKPLWNETTLDKLKKNLFLNYDRYARPEEHYNITKVKIGLTVTHLETDEIKSTITVSGWIQMVWTDSKLKWDENDYGGLSVARIAEHEVWQPDIFHYTSATGGESVTRFSNPNVLIYPTGEVLFVPPLKLTALCQFDLRYWPFDTQHCRFIFGSWTHSGYEIALELYNSQTSVSIETTMESSAWTVINSTAEVKSKTYDCCVEPYPSAEFNLTIARKSRPYNAIILTPAIVIGLLILMQFWLPPQTEEKLILNGFTSITIVMFLIYFTSQTAGTFKTPLIVLFYSTSLCMVCLSMVGTVALMSLSKIKQTHSLSCAIKNRLKGNLGKWLRLDYTFEEVPTISQSEQATKKDAGGSNSMAEGRDIAKVASDKYTSDDYIVALAIDRLFFIVYSLVFIALAVLYMY